MYTLLKAFKTGTTIAPEARSRLASMGWPEKAEALVREYSKYDAVLKKYRNDPAGVKVSCTPTHAHTPPTVWLECVCLARCCFLCC